MPKLENNDCSVNGKEEATEGDRKRTSSRFRVPKITSKAVLEFIKLERELLQHQFTRMTSKAKVDASSANESEEAQNKASKSDDEQLICVENSGATTGTCTKPTLLHDDSTELIQQYVNRTTFSSHAFSLIEMFNSLDEDGDGYLSVNKDMPIAFKMIGLSEDKYPKLSETRFDTFTFCKLMERLQHDQLPEIRGESPSSLRMSRRISRTTCLASNTDAVMSDSPLNLFLGGACNPTTWRQDIAIPFCLRHGITYFNPQVDEWHPDLVKVEARAKEKSQLMLFVINEETRGIASMVETAELLTSGREMVLVLADITPEVASARGMSDEEIKDINRGRAYLADIAARYKTPTFVDIKRGLVEVAKRLGSMHSSHRISESKVQPS